MAVTLKGNNGTYEGTSEDNKPLDVPVNTEFNELDTGKTYYFDGETWNEEPPCEGSGFTPTTEQLAAMNSGIDSTKVAQIEANENNISYNTNMGVKNLSRWNSGTSTQAYPTMASQIPFTSDGGEYTISYNTALTTGAISVGFKDSNGNATVTVEIGNASKIKTVTIPATTAYFNIYTLAYGDYSNFMICKKAVYDNDPTYQPYAMTNAEITAWILAHS